MNIHPRLIISAVLSYAITTFLVAVLLLASGYPAYPADDRPAMQPPWEYNYPYRGELVIVYALPERVHKLCTEGEHAVKNIPLGNIIRACALTAVDYSWCQITMPFKRFYTTQAWDALLRHEIGHCNGWAENHPQ